MQNTKRLFVMLSSLLLLLMVSGSGLAQAQSTYEIRYIGGSDPSNNCGSEVGGTVGENLPVYIELEFIINADVASPYLGRIFDGRNQPMDSDHLGQPFVTVDPNFPGITYENPESILSGTYAITLSAGRVSLPASIPEPVSRPWRVELVRQSPAVQVVAELTFDPADYFAACATLPDMRPQPVTFSTDANTNEAQLFLASDPEGDPALHVYGTESGQGTLELVITNDDIAPYLENVPSNNTPIMNNGESSSAPPVTLYALTTGEFQINVGPDIDGNVEVMIFDDIPPSVVYGYTYNIYDPPETWAPPWANGG